MNPHRRAFITAIVLLGAAGMVAGTSASFNAKTTNDAAFTTDALNNPTNVTSSFAGYTLSVNWTPGSMTSGATTFGHRLSQKVAALGSVTGAPPACTWSDSFPTTTTMANNATSTSVTLPNNRPGLWVCWRLDLQHPATGTPILQSQSSVTGIVQDGFVVQSVTVANGGVSGKMDAGDIITLKLNQPATKSTLGSPTNVCFLTANASSTTGTVYVGRSVSTLCAASSTLLGSMPVTNLAVGAIVADRTPTYAATFNWNGSCTGTSCDELIITLGARGTGTVDPSVTIGATSLFTPIATLTSAATVSGNPLPTCTSNNGAAAFCKPTASGSF